MTLLGRLLIGAALTFLPSAALACQCSAPEDVSNAEREHYAQWMAGLGVIIVEAERIDEDRRPFEPLRYRVHRVLSGSAPEREILIYPRLARTPDGSWIGEVASSCDYEGTRGFRKVMAFVPARGSTRTAFCGVLASANDSGLTLLSQCAQYALDDPRLLRRVLALREAQAGVSRSSRPPSSSR